MVLPIGASAAYVSGFLMPNLWDGGEGGDDGGEGCVTTKEVFVCNKLPMIYMSVVCFCAHAAELVSQ